MSSNTFHYGYKELFKIGGNYLKLSNGDFGRFIDN